MKKARQMLEENNFEQSVQMMPSGEKIIKCRLTKHKIFVRTTILLKVSDFFATAWPNYSKTSTDRPLYYSSDPNQA
jgi:hypothetical protein